jgi:hypothetical protein
MPKVGDYVIIESTKVGAQRREGNLVGVVGSLLKVQWIDGTESVISPGAGSVRIETRAAGSKGSSKKARAAKAQESKKSSQKKKAGKKR